MNLHVRSQYQLRTEILTMLGDTSNARWTDAQVYYAINQAVALWGGRVLVPHLYQPANYSWDNNTYEYDLPAWIDERYITPQMRRVIPYNGYPMTDDGTETWVDVPGWSIEPTATEGRKLRFQSLPFEVDARIIYWGQPQQIPTTVYTLAATLNDNDTTITLTANSNDVYPNMMWLKTTSEYMLVTFDSRPQSNQIIYDIVARGLFNSYQSAAVNTSTVYACVAAPDERLFVQLHHQAMMYLHLVRMGLAAPEERSVHGQMIQYHKTEADRFWRSWTPNRPIKWRPDRRAL